MENNIIENNITIGIEGLVGAGKTSICRELLDKIPNSIILHGGNLYRGIVFALMSSGADMNKIMHGTDKPIDIKQMMDILKVELKIENRESVVYVDGKEINEDNLQSDTTSMAVSKIAKDADNTKFYIFGRELIDAYKKQYNLIISGRDTRVDRKMHQYEDETITREELKKHIEERDMLQEQAGFYRRYSKTIDVDVTECKNAEESAMKILEKIAQ